MRARRRRDTASITGGLLDRQTFEAKMDAFRMIADCTDHVVFAITPKDEATASMTQLIHVARSWAGVAALRTMAGALLDSADEFEEQVRAAEEAAE